MKILVADDSKTNLTLITTALKKLGHEVMPAQSGHQAIELFEVARPDLIILDVVMENIDGFECARRIRALDPNEWIPIIFLSASVDDDSIAKGIDAGGDDYLSKPFSEITLAAKIKAMQRIADMRKKLFETTQKLYLLSSTDALTGVYNRFQFDHSLQEILVAADRYKHNVALLFLDLDHFKNINDTYGHHIGDLLLIEVTKRLKTTLRAHDFIARLGGDEFAIILREVESATEAGCVANKIIHKVAQDYLLEGHNIRHGISVGIAMYPEAGTNAQNIVLNADIAMYHAKSLGRNNYQFFTQELHEKYRQHMNLELSLKFAQEKKELFLTYQPIFNLLTHRLTGIEVILCWKHAKYGLIPQNVFIPMADENGLMPQIGNWVLRSAVEQSQQWPLNEFNNFKFAITVTPSQLLHSEFLSELKNVMAYTHLKTKRIELQLTESTIMSSTSNSFKEILKELHSLGIQISIKDFGTGYSSLTRLKQLSINTLKIEKSFIGDMLWDQNSEVIVNTIISLGENLGLQIIADGIETPQQLAMLIEKKCPQGQGSYLGRPLGMEKMSNFFELLKTNSVEEI